LSDFGQSIVGKTIDDGGIETKDMSGLECLHCWQSLFASAVALGKF